MTTTPNPRPTLGELALTPVHHEALADTARLAAREAAPQIVDTDETSEIADAVLAAVMSRLATWHDQNTTGPERTAPPKDQPKRSRPGQDPWAAHADQPAGKPNNGTGSRPYQAFGLPDLFLVLQGKEPPALTDALRQVKDAVEKTLTDLGLDRPDDRKP